jgi:hypothetical protein
LSQTTNRLVGETHGLFTDALFYAGGPMVLMLQHYVFFVSLTQLACLFDCFFVRLTAHLTVHKTKESNSKLLTYLLHAAESSL